MSQSDTPINKDISEILYTHAPELTDTEHIKTAQALNAYISKELKAVIGDEKEIERLYDNNSLEFDKDGKHYVAVPLYSAVMKLKEYNREQRQRAKGRGYSV